MSGRGKGGKGLSKIVKDPKSGNSDSKSDKQHVEKCRRYARGCPSCNGKGSYFHIHGYWESCECKNGTNGKTRWCKTHNNYCFD